MASVNKVIIIGNLGRDPDTRYTAEGGTAITTITVATSRRYKDSNGQPQEETEWHRVVFFGRQAEIAAEYLRKGRPVYVEGRLRTRKWQGPDGQDRYSTEIIAESMQMLGSRERTDAPAGGFESAPRRPAVSGCGRRIWPNFWGGWRGIRTWWRQIRPLSVRCSSTKFSGRLRLFRRTTA